MKKKKLSKDAADISLSPKKQSLLKNKGFWGLFIIVIMIGSVFGFSAFYSSGQDTNTFLEYNGYEFVNRGRGWETKLNDQDVSFLYSPKDVESIPYSSVDLIGNEVYLVLDSDNLDEYGYEVSRIKGFLKLKNVNSYIACLNDEGCGDLPVVSCGTKNVIILRTSESNKIYNEDGCVVINGDDSDYMKVVDRFIYGFYGVV